MGVPEAALLHAADTLGGAVPRRRWSISRKEAAHVLVFSILAQVERVADGLREADVEERDVRVDEGEQHHLEDEMVFVIGISAVVLEAVEPYGECCVHPVHDRDPDHR